MAQVLVADADAGMWELLVEPLAEAGHKVLGVDDGEAAWHLLRTLPAGMVAVLDIATPRLDGLHVLQKVLIRPAGSRAAWSHCADSFAIMSP